MTDGKLCSFSVANSTPALDQELRSECCNCQIAAMKSEKQSSLWPPDVKSKLIRKDPDAGKDWGQDKGVTENEMVGWHHWLNDMSSSEFPGGGGGAKDREPWRAAVNGVKKSQTRLSDWTSYLKVAVTTQSTFLPDTTIYHKVNHQTVRRINPLTWFSRESSYLAHMFHYYQGPVSL